MGAGDGTVCLFNSLLGKVRPVNSFSGGWVLGKTLIFIQDIVQFPIESPGCSIPFQSGLIFFRYCSLLSVPMCSTLAVA